MAHWNRPSSLMPGPTAQLQPGFTTSASMNNKKMKTTAVSRHIVNAEPWSPSSRAMRRGAGIRPFGGYGAAHRRQQGDRLDDVAIEVVFSVDELPGCFVPGDCLFHEDTPILREDWHDQLSLFLARRMAHVMMFTEENEQTIKHIFSIVRSLPLTAKSDNAMVVVKEKLSLEQIIRKFQQNQQDGSRNNGSALFNWSRPNDESLLLTLDCSHRLFFHPDNTFDDITHIATTPFLCDLEAARDCDLAYLVETIGSRDYDVSLFTFACHVIAKASKSNLERFARHHKADDLVSVVTENMKKHNRDDNVLRAASLALCHMAIEPDFVVSLFESNVFMYLEFAVKKSPSLGTTEAFQNAVLRFFRNSARAQVEDKEMQGA
ncbi:expressed unknown protein (Partial), partial [Seminavis robusta]|eukprot:Sro535_g161850.1 n/a (375) ;mRNA; r:2-1126